MRVYFAEKSWELFLLKSDVFKYNLDLNLICCEEKGNFLKLKNGVNKYLKDLFDIVYLKKGRLFIKKMSLKK